jgi:hypothetical protein
MPEIRPPLAWRGLLLVAGLQLVLHLATNGRYGIFRDEYYYLACAHRIDWGYVDQPPLSIWALALWRALFGDGIHALRILPGMATAALVVVTGPIAAELGGRRTAQLLAAVASAIGAAGLVIGGFYSMNAFDLLAWAVAFLLLVKIVRTGDGRLWPWLGGVLALGLLNKIGLLVFGAALAVGLLLTGYRRHLRDRRLWAAAAIAALGLLPYVLWNAAHGWPTVEFVRNAQMYKIKAMPLPAYLGEVVLEANPVTLPLWGVGLVWLLGRRRLRMLGLVWLATLVLLLVQKSKPYYLMGAMPPLLAAGGVAWERWSERHRWIRWVWAADLAAGTAIFLPMAVPLLSPAGFLVYQERLGIAPAEAEVGHTSAMPQYFSDRFGWQELARAASEAYVALSPEDREHCIALCNNYGEAGALEYWSRKYELPAVCSGHNNYAFWTPPPDDTRVVITIGYEREGLQARFARVEPVPLADSPYALERKVGIFACHEPNIRIAELWTRARHFI